MRTSWTHCERKALAVFLGESVTADDLAREGAAIDESS